MGQGLRRFSIWIVSLAAIAAVYLIYTRLSDMPDLRIVGKDKVDQPIDPNTVKGEGRVGMIGGVGIGTVERARFTDFTAEKTISREFGFEKLLHEEGSEWVLQKPFMTVYRDNATFYVTAEKGRVKVEQSGTSQPAPKDASLIGNVLIRVVPKQPDDTGEYLVRLDEVVFFSDRSLFTSAGPVIFTSQKASLSGSGMELIYNDEHGRLEYFRLIKLNELKLKVDREPQVKTVTGDLQDDKKTAANPSNTPVVKNAQQVASANSKTSYIGVLSGDVTVESPEHHVYANQLWIKNLILSSGDDSKNSSASTAPSQTDDAKPKTSNISDVTASDGIEKVPYEVVLKCTGPIVFIPGDSGEELKTHIASGSDPLSRPVEPGINTFAAGIIEYDASLEEMTAFGNNRLILYTDSFASQSDGKGTTLPVTIESSESLKYFAAESNVVFTGNCIARMPSAEDADRSKYTLKTPQLTVYIPQGSEKGNAVAQGPFELTLYPDKPIVGIKGQALPIKVTAEDNATFMPDEEKIVLVGDTICTMFAQENAIEQQYTIRAPRLSLDIKDSSDEDIDISHVRADGGLVRIFTLKQRNEEQLGGVELKCEQFDYDVASNSVIVTGPGTIVMDNSKIVEPNAPSSGKFSLQTPSYATIEGFKSLEYMLDLSTAVFQSGSDRMAINYFPIVSGKYGEQVSVTAGRIEAELAIIDGKTKLVTLNAIEGISYEDESIEFEGTKMFLDTESSIIKASGSETTPCVFNGTVVQGIEHNLKTGKSKFPGLRGGVVPGSK